MRAVVQRVSRAKVTVETAITGEIGRGFLVLLGVADGDTAADAVMLADKLVGLRVFEDHDGKMNLALADVGGAMLVVSQFTLLGDCRKGRRPSFIAAARPDVAEALYRTFVAEGTIGDGLSLFAALGQRNNAVVESASALAALFRRCRHAVGASTDLHDIAWCGGLLRTHDGGEWLILRAQ